jgi:hypothetical protein
MNIGLSNDLTQFGKNKINAIRDGFIVCHDSFMQMEKPDIVHHWIFGRLICEKEE